MRYHSEIIKAIWDKYTQDLPNKEDVLWVGPLMDGMLELMPEMFDSPSRPSGPTGRRAVRLFFQDIRLSPDDVRAFDLIGPRCIVQRKTWPRAAGSGEPLKLFLSESRVVDMEPGELLNSVSVTRGELGETLLVDPVKGEVIEPIIRVDKQYGLHMLWRDDLFEFAWTSRRPRQEFVRQFKLRPRSEGSSELRSEARDDIKVF